MKILKTANYNKLDETKDIGEGNVMTPKTEDDWVEKERKIKMRKRTPFRDRKAKPTKDEKWDELMRKVIGKKAALEELSGKQIFEKNLAMGKDERQAAADTIDIMTGGTFAAMEGGRREALIDKVLKSFLETEVPVVENSNFAKSKKIVITAKSKKLARDIPPSIPPHDPEEANSSKLQGREPKWNSGRVFTKAPGFGPGKEVEEQRIITIRPEENEFMALKREGFDPLQSRIEIIDN
jgi:hypothetical protein